MKKLLILMLVGFSFVSTVYARDDVAGFSIAEAMADETFSSTLGADVSFFFGEQSHGAVEKDLGEYKTNKKTNAFGKSDKIACEWAFLSALISLRDRAMTEGGNAVVNIRSNYKSKATSSEETFQCGAGTWVAGVALIGTVVRIAE